MSQSSHEHFRTVRRDYSDASILMHEAIARRAGLSGTDHKYLGIIVDRGRMSAGELANASGLTTGAVTGLIDRLEREGLVKRELDKQDRRKIHIVPVEANVKKRIHPLFKRLQQKTNALVESFSEKEIAVLERYFTAATAIMHQTTDELNNQH
ncbi:MAG TPA: MarR family transcriptional regulator [Flavobacteriales bacterium]|jgi:DNA-binding MarR family transcriptional regulator|nr:MarR family transcriptional regulator [Flavobacteriales bacterium]